jgi:hypothetical protein
MTSDGSEAVRALRRALADRELAKHPTFVGLTVVSLRGGGLRLRLTDALSGVSGPLATIRDVDALAVVPALIEELNVWRSAVSRGTNEPSSPDVPKRRGMGGAPNRIPSPLVRRRSA